MFRRLNLSLGALTLICFFPHFLFAQDFTFHGPRRSIVGGGNSLSRTSIIDTQFIFLTNNRGVLMQALVTFQDTTGRAAPPSAVFIKRVSANSNSGFCLQIKNDPCIRFLLPDAQLKALYHFVENGRYQAFTLPSDSKDPQAVIAQIRTQGMVPVNDGYVMQDWIAGELADPWFARVFRYIDFDDPFDFTSSDFDATEGQKLRDEMNAATGSSDPPAGKAEDLTYFNSDLHANFVTHAFNGAAVCDGIPARYYWRLGGGQRYAYITEVEFAAPDFEDDDHRQLYMDAQTVFCTTAILRTLHANNRAGVAELGR